MIPCPNCNNDLEIIIPKGTVGWNMLGGQIISEEDKRASKTVCDKCETMIALSYLEQFGADTTKIF